MSPDPITTTVGSRAAISGGIWTRHKIQAYRTVRRSLREVGLDPGFWGYPVRKWLASHDYSDLARREGVEDLVRALEKKSGSVAFDANKAVQLQNALFTNFDDLKRGKWVAGVTSENQRQILEAIGKRPEPKRNLKECATIRSDGEIGKWVSEHDTWGSLQSHLSGGNLPPYATRLYDDDLLEQFNEALCSVDGDDLWHRSLILRGTPKSGKTRSILEAIVQVADAGVPITVLHPHPDYTEEALERINHDGFDDLGDEDRVFVVLLDDLQFISGALSQSALLDHPTKAYPQFLEWLVTPNQQVVVVAATTWPTITNNLNPRTVPQTIKTTFDERAFQVEEAWTSEEIGNLDQDLQNALLDQAKATSTDPHHAAAAMAAAPILNGRLRSFSDDSDAESDETTIQLDVEARHTLVSALLVAFLQKDVPDRASLELLYKTLTDDADIHKRFDAALRWGVATPAGGEWAIVQSFERSNKSRFAIAEFLIDTAVELCMERILA